MSSPKQEQLDNTVVLNVTVFEEVPGKQVELRRHKTINITDLLKENGVTSFYEINAISQFSGEEDEFGSSPYEVRFIVDEVRIRNLGKSIENIIDAAIVNSNQSKAVKQLVNGEIGGFLQKCWNTID